MSAGGGAQSHGRSAGDEQAGDERAARGLIVGLRATVTAQVTQADTASALGSGDVPVLGTPRLLALAEAATVAATAPRLADGQTTVGTAVSMEHRRPSLPGTAIEVEAELTEVDGRRLVFMFIAFGSGTGEDAVIGAGTVERVLVDQERFLARIPPPTAS